MTRRSWWLRYTLPILGASLLAALADTALGYPTLNWSVEPQTVLEWFGGPFSAFVTVVTLVPVVSSAVARLHDHGYSAWRLLWMLVPIVGWVVLLIELGFLSGDAGPNRYGPAPGPVAPSTYARG